MSHAQEVFDKVVAHLLTQNEKSRVGSDCKYYSGTQSNHLKCAVGCLIEWEHYSPGLEGLHVNDYDVRMALKRSGIDVSFEFNRTDTVLNLLINLQQIHDTIPLEHWPDKLKEIAEWYGLEYNPPAETQNA